MAVKPGPGRPAKEKDQPQTEEQPVLAGTVNEEFDPLAPLDFELDSEEEEDTIEKVPEAVLTMSAVTALLQAQEERFKSMLAENKAQPQVVYVQADQGQNTKPEKSTYVKDMVDDYMDIPEVYFTFSSGFFHHGEFRNGKESLPPNGAIEFKPVIRMRRASKTGGQQTISISSAKIHSKAEAEWLRNSSLIGIKFHRQVEEVANIDAIWASKLIEANTSIARLTDVQVIARCKDLSIRVTEDVPAMRRQLVNKIAEESKTLEDKISEKTRKAIEGYDAIEINGERQMREIITKQ